MEFVYLPVFIKNIKELAKKYPSVKKDFATLLDRLVDNPTLGASLGKDCYKIRMAISSKKRGKSGGARVITCVKVEQDRLFFLTIYDKSEQPTITDAELKIFLRSIDK